MQQIKGFKSYLLGNKYVFLTLLIFGSIYASISFGNHYYFRTNALDLGFYTKALYDYAHLNLANSLMIKEVCEPMLGGHFDLYLLLFSPLIYVFGTYTLLVIQLVAILFGALGIYRYFQLRQPLNERLPYLAMLYFLLFFGVYSALSFDYHSVVISTCCIPWLFVYLKKENYLSVCFVFLFLLVGQENTSLFLLFIFIGLSIEYRKEKKKRVLLLVFAGISLSYFMLITHVVIPIFSNSHSYTGFNYSILGKSPMQALLHCINYPITTFQALFVNHTNHPFGNYIKFETHLILLLSGMFFLFRKPAFLIMLLPIYGQKFFNDNYVYWSIDGQYSIEFSVILAIGIFTFISSQKTRKTQGVLSIFAVVCVLIGTIRVLDHTEYNSNKSKIRFYQSSHYTRNYDVAKVHQIISRLPQDAKISAQSQLIPHLVLRKTIYQFPLVKDAEYVLYSPLENNYPLTEAAFIAQIEGLKKQNNWTIHFEDKNIVLLKKTVK
jgi:uncharacterized membrane protein